MHHYIVFAPSMATLSLALRHIPISHISVLTYSEPIQTFCKKAGIKVRMMKTIEDTTREGIKLFKKYIDKLCDEIKDERIVFSTRNNFKWEGYFLRKLQKNNSVVFENIDPEVRLIRFTPARFFFSWGYRKAMFNRTMYWFFFGTWYSIFKNGTGVYIIGWTLEKCKSMFSRPDYMEVSCFESNQKIILEKYRVPDSDILFIDNASKFVPAEVLGTLVAIILKNTTSKVLLKPHYNKQFAPAPPLPQKFEMLPVELPAEFLRGKTKLVIGFSSTALLGFAGDVKIISLMNFTKGNSEELEKYVMTSWMNNVDTISYPKTYEEFERELKNAALS